MAELIVALDTNNARKLIHWAKTFKGVTPWVKVGLELLTGVGSSVVEYLKKQKFNVFVDMKLFDIPNTIAQSVYAATGHADMLTLHTLGGEAMMRAAVDAVKKAGEEAALKFINEGQQKTQEPSKPLLLGVTVLTSVGQGDLPFYEGPVSNMVLRLARNAQKAGLDGVICSGHEVPMIKAECGNDFLCVTPGIRPAGTENYDQCRVMTPAEAVAAGADYLVVGRPITGAKDPVAATRAIINDMQRVSL